MGFTHLGLQSRFPQETYKHAICQRIPCRSSVAHGRPQYQEPVHYTKTEKTSGLRASGVVGKTPNSKREARGCWRVLFVWPIMASTLGAALSESNICPGICRVVRGYSTRDYVQPRMAVIPSTLAKWPYWKLLASSSSKLQGFDALSSILSKEPSILVYN